jgi:PTH1 family peptidyl-tRNA hydrolase
MKLVAGLGNPGRKYQGTRHNIGFDVLDRVARQHACSPGRSKFDAQTAEINVAGERVLLLWPTTFMNLSGASVGKARDFYKIDGEDILVVCDDINLPLAKLRFRAGGSSGGQKGLADILRRLGTEQVSRLRIGVGPVPEGWDAADFVLGRFGRGEGALVEDAVARAAEGVVCWASEGIHNCMNRYN